MTSTMRHRGPDGTGYLTRPGIGLGMCRLSIVDLEGGTQPIFNEDRTVAVVFNGEIYNFVELRRELVAAGHHFATESDTEVLVHLYEDLGTGLVKHLNGMFGFAIWDAAKKLLFIARDRLGEKPIYYRLLSDTLIFGSELKALLKYAPAHGNDLSIDSIDDYLAYGYIPAPRSIFRNVHKLPAASTLVYQSGKVSVERYWSPPWFEREGAPRPESELLDEFHSLLLDSVKLRLRADVPVGAFLSGGIDSSLIVAMAAGVSARPLSTFCVAFDESNADESAQARLVAERCGTQHHEIVVSNASLDILPRLVEQYDEPFADASSVPTYYVTREASRHLKVCLSGDGGDELFGGYSQYLWEPWERAVSGWSPAVRRTVFTSLASAVPPYVKGRGWLERLASTGAVRHQRSIGIFSPEERRALFRPEFVKHVNTDAWLFKDFFAGNSLGEIERRLAADQATYLSDDILVKVDRDSMLNSLEVRVPFLDHRLVEFANKLPLEMKVRNGMQKYLPRQLLKKLGLDDVASRPKHGFGLPLQVWMAGEQASSVRELLLSADSRCHALFRANAIRQWLDRNRTHGRDFGERLWALLWFEQWCRRFNIS
jgi:asparagine synthase (glutamine-hydrolysing)